MSALYGVVQGNRGKATRCGHYDMTTTAATWAGAVRVELTRNAGDPAGAAYVVRLIPWNGRGESKVLAEGRLGDSPGPVDLLARADALRDAYHKETAGDE